MLSQTHWSCGTIPECSGTMGLGDTKLVDADGTLGRDARLTDWPNNVEEGGGIWTLGGWGGWDWGCYGNKKICTGKVIQIQHWRLF